MPILFYKHEDPFGCFSNFSRHTVEIYGRVWKTSEHAFQAMKFHHSPVHMDLVFNAPTPGQAANLHGRNRSYPLRPDWNSIYEGPLRDIKVFPDLVNRQGVTEEPPVHRVKDAIMYEVCLAKFEQNADIRQTLLDTGTRILIEDTTDDAYWGWGSSHVGENKLGRILMSIRDKLGQA